MERISITGTAYSYIISYIKLNGYAPTIREICTAVGYKSPASGHKVLQELQQKGLIEFKPKQPRALRAVGYTFVCEDDARYWPTEAGYEALEHSHE